MTSGAPRRSPWLLPLELVLSVVISITLFVWTRQEFVWVLGGLAAGWSATAALRRWRGPQAPDARTRKSGQVLVGVSLGPVLAAQSLGSSASALPLLLGAVVVALVGAVLVARAYARLSGVDGLTAGLGTLPGGVGIMASVAAETGGHASLVALLQGARVAVVVSVVPLIFVLGGAEGSAEGSLPPLLPEDGGGYAVWAALVVAAFAASAVARRLGVPVASLLGPMVLGVVVAVVVRFAVGAEQPLELPYVHSAAGQVLLGVTVGEYLAQSSHASRRSVVGGLGGVLATLLLSLLGAAVLTAVTEWSFLTCVLITAPGGAPEMIVLAAATPSELHLVVIAQLTRQIAVNALMPLWLRLFAAPPPEPARA